MAVRNPHKYETSVERFFAALRMTGSRTNPKGCCHPERVKRAEGSSHVLWDQTEPGVKAPPTGELAAQQTERGLTDYLYHCSPSPFPFATSPVGRGQERRFTVGKILRCAQNDRMRSMRRSDEITHISGCHPERNEVEPKDLFPGRSDPVFSPSSSAMIPPDTNFLHSLMQQSVDLLFYFFRIT